MSNTKTIHLMFFSEEDFVDRFVRYVVSLESQPTKVRFSDIVNRIKETPPAEKLAESTQFAELLESLRTTPSGLRATLVISLSLKGVDQPGINFRFDKATGYSIPLEWEYNPHNLTHPILFDKLPESFEVRTENEAVAIKIPEIADNRFAAYQDAILSMRQLVANLSEIQGKSIATNEEFLTKKSSEFLERVVAQETRLQARSNEVEQKLSSGLLELEQTRADLNLRESKKVRRDLLQKIETLVEKQTSFERSKETKGADKTTYIVVGLLIATGLILCGTALGLAAGKKIEPIVFYPAFLSGTILCGANAIVLTWFIINRSRKNAMTDFSIMQYSRDMYRMSWVAELIFEAQTNQIGDKTEKVDIPPQILESFTSLLFSDPKDGSTHPLDELRKYARRFKKFNIGANGIQAESNEGR